MLSRRLAVFTAALACLLAGCQPPAPTPTPVPTYQCTPEAGGDPFECTQQQYDQMVAKDKLYAEAEAVYRKYVAEDARIMRAGGVTEATPALLETTTGEFLEDALSDYRLMAQEGIHAKGEDPVLALFRREPGKSKTGSLIAATTCVDGSPLEFFDGKQSLGKGQIARDQTYFARFDGLLKIIGADGEQVQSCE